MRAPCSLPKANTVYVQGATESAIRAAVAGAIAAGGAWRIMLPDAGTTGIALTSPLPLVTGLTYIGVKPVMTHSTSVPDDNISAFVGGTWFSVPTNVKCFQAQDTSGNALDADKGSPDANFTTTGIREAGIYNVGISGSSIGISLGAVNQAGILYGAIEDVYIEGAATWGVSCKNYMRTTFRRIYTIGCGSGQLYEQAVATATLQPGNSDFYDLFDNVTGGDLASAAARRLHRSIVFSATGGSNNNQNRVFACQVNRSGKAKATYNADTGGTGEFTLAAGKGAELAVGMPVKFTHAGGNGNITVGQSYVVYSVSTDTIKVANSLTGAAITGSFADTAEIETYGFPGIEIVGGSVGTGGSAGTSGTVTNLYMGGGEAENVCQDSLWLTNASGCILHITEFVTVTSGEQHIVMRSSQTTNEIHCTKPFSTDLDGSSVQNVLIGTWDATNSVQNSGIRLGWNSTSARASLSLGSVLSTRGADLERRAPSGGQFLYPLASMGQRVHGNYGAADGTTINAGQSGYLRCTTSGSGTIAWNLPTIDSHTVGLFFHIRNSRSGIVNIVSSGTQYMNNVSAKNTVALAAVSGSVVAGATFVACDDGSGSGFHWDVILDAGATIP